MSHVKTQTKNRKKERKTTVNKGKPVNFLLNNSLPHTSLPKDNNDKINLIIMYAKMKATSSKSTDFIFYLVGVAKCKHGYTRV